MPKKAIIIGAGPAGLTAAYELLKRTDIKPIVLEKCKQVGGISKTIDYKGNKMDFGPHRFFSKSDRVMNWWTNIMPLHTAKGEDLTISYQNKSRTLHTSDFLTTEESDGKPPAKSMLVIQRLTRIYFLRQFFAYPIQLSIATLGQLGILTTIKIVFSYLYARLFPRKPQKSLEDFMINKFGSVLYHIFFKDYTEKVWGMDCNKISADWGAQRIKGVSLSKAVIHAAKALTKKKKSDLGQKGTETSLIEQFLYPAMGAGAMWEEVARQVEILGGRIVSDYEVTNIHIADNKVYAISANNSITGKHELLEGDYFVSTMPIQELVAGLHGDEVPTEVKDVATGLIYRDFVYTGVLVKKMTMDTPKDSWIYIQEKDVKVARMQVYNNWGPYMVADPNTVWLGLEYFCTKGDAIWNMSDEEIKRLAVEELVKMDLVQAENVLDSTVNRMEKTYPAYFGTYERFDVIRNYLDKFDNLFLVGRNGMHKYNNTDHSMLTAMAAVDNIEAGVLTKDNLWEINAEQEYHEEKKEPGITKKEISRLTELFSHSNRNRVYLFIASLMFLAQFIIFKLLYPFADYSNDSYTYIMSAIQNESISMRPIGYSKILTLISLISYSDTAVVLFQYISLCVAILFFFFTVLYHFEPSSKASNIIFGVIILNPTSLYISNYIGPDALFTAVTLLWFSHLFWIIRKPKIEDIFIQIILLYIALSLRYNALYFPFLSIITLLLSNKNRLYRIVSSSAIVVGVALFIILTIEKREKQSGVRMFSTFSGWQLANNALHIYRSTSPESADFPKGIYELNDITTRYFENHKHTSFSKDATADYMWKDDGPLKSYWHLYISKNKVKDSLSAWHAIAPNLSSFGIKLIRRHPITFAEQFVIPNIKNYLSPPLETLLQYNLGSDTVKKIAQLWFNYKTNRVTSIDKKIQYQILLPYKSLNTIIQLSLPILLAICLVVRAPMLQKKMKLGLYVVLLFTLLHFSFSILSAPVVFRYQYFMFLIGFPFTALLAEKLSNVLNYNLPTFPIRLKERKA